MTHVLITGATGAIGSAISQKFLDNGHIVTGLDTIHPENAQNHNLTHQPYTHHRNKNYTHITCDVSDYMELENVFTAIKSAPQHVITVAGGGHPEETNGTPIDKINPQTFIDAINKNLMSALYTSAISAPYLQTHETSSITFTGSINAVEGLGMHAYSAAKAGLSSLARTLTKELAASGTRVNVVAPGTVITPRTEKLWSHKPDHFTNLKNTTATGETISLPELANIYYALAVDLTGITGQTIIADNGQTAVWQK